jgi:hypothetical protein
MQRQRVKKVTQEHGKGKEKKKKGSKREEKIGWLKSRQKGFFLL